MAEYVFGANILENLTTGMYQDSKVIYREYIQNACDQIDKAEKLGILRSRNSASKYPDLGEGVVYNWLAYAKKFGWVSLESIKSHEGATKYINKSLGKSVTELEANKYYRSQHLRESTVIKQGKLTVDVKTLCKNPEKDYFKNDYCSIAWLDYSDKLLDTLKNSIVRGF